VDLGAWRLNVTGLVKKPGLYTLEQVRALPKVEQNVRHVCVEGWDVIGKFAGARLRDLLTLVDADPGARFVAIECADHYYESIDMASAVHPQTLLSYEMYGRPLERGHGAPLRLTIPTKLGYKQAKYLTKIEVTNVLTRRGLWEDQGYGWFAGL
jgi:DMSO/TMAO reductase YedYZ molybdopterin-dependent catalytic subunit